MDPIMRLDATLLHGHDCVLITGGCGAIGAVVVNELKATHPNTRFVNLDALTYCGKEEHVRPPYNNYRFVHGDITDAALVSQILEAEQPTLLIHLAAETHVDQSFGDSFRFTQTNILGTHVLLECAKRYGRLRMFLHMSTDEVYGSVDDGEASACHEQAMFAPSNPYAATKAGAEMLCHAYMKSFDLPVVIMRCNNAISPYQHEEKLIPACVECALKGKRVPVHGDGSAKRTFIHAADIASAIAAIVARGSTGGIYNIGTGADMEYTVLQVVQRVLDLVHGEGSCRLQDWVKHKPDRAFQDLRYSIDSSALRALGWQERVSFDDAVRTVIAQRMELWEQARNSNEEMLCNTWGSLQSRPQSQSHAHSDPGAAPTPKDYYADLICLDDV